MLRFLYRGYSLVVCGMDVPVTVVLGEDVRIYHGLGFVVQKDVIIGDRCVLRQGVTLGERRSGEGGPVLGSDVDVGSGAQILGHITVGDGARIGAGALVIGDVAPGDVVAGVPARVLRTVK